MSPATTFIIADNQAVTCAGIEAYVARNVPDSDIRLAKDKKELMSTLMACSGDSVVVLDYTLFDIPSIDALLVLCNRFINSHWILFSNELSESLIRRLTAEGSISMLLKESPGEEISAAIKSAQKRERYLCHQISNLLISESVKRENATHLTTTEIDILKLIAHGKSVKEIAAIRYSSYHTINTHKKNIFRKLEVNNVHEATKYALRAGIVEMMEYYI